MRLDPDNKKAKDGIAAHFSHFIHIYVDPIVLNSKITSVRKIIRSSKKLNNLLYHNSDGLHEAYNQSKKFDPNYKDGKTGFTINSARFFFETLKERKVLNVTLKQVSSR